MVTDAPTLMMLRSRHRWRLQDFRPAAMFLGGQRLHIDRGTRGWGGRLRRDQESGGSPNAKSRGLPPVPSLTFTIGTCVIPPVLIMLTWLSCGILTRILIAIIIRILRSQPRQHSPWRAAARRGSCRHEGSSEPSWTRRRPGREASHRQQLPAVEEQLLGLRGRRYVDSGRHEGREDRGGREEDHQVLQGVRNLQPCSPGWWSISSSVQCAAAAAATDDRFQRGRPVQAAAVAMLC